jgi:uncharacterized protein
VEAMVLKKNAAAAQNESALHLQNSALKINTQNTEGRRKQKKSKNIRKVHRILKMANNNQKSTNKVLQSSKCGWQINTYSSRKLKDSILIEGLPGIGNVGKIVADYLIDELKAEKLMDFFSHCLPNSVFVNETNTVSLPSIELYYKRINNQDFLFLSGDVQPSTEEGSYSFSELILDIAQSYNCKEIITLGGIGLGEIPQTPVVYCAPNDLKFVEKFIKAGAKKEVYGVVGPIMGISGLLVGLSEKRRIKATALLAETLGHPMYLGLKGAKESLAILCKVYKIKVNFKELEKEIAAMDSADGEEHDPKLASLQKLKKHKETNYIG